jgi:integrase
MGTIAARKRGSGTRYTAQIRIRKHGEIMHNESATFDRKALALEWMRRRESELDVMRARGQPYGSRKTLRDLLDWYITVVGKQTKWGRSKAADLERLKGYAIARQRADRITAADYIAHVEKRRQDGTGAATAGNDLVWIRQVLKTARPALKLSSIDLRELDDAAHSLRSRKLIAKSRRRKRRVSADEQRVILAHFDARAHRLDMPMGDIVRFALLSARRQEEITRLRWADLHETTAILRDVKHPREKEGNDKEFRMLAEARAIIDRQPRAENAKLVFPFNPRSIGASFSRAMRLLGIDDLHFHDLRHEATSRLFERGYSIQEVAQFTLHDSWATLKLYTHLRPADVPER